MPLYNPGDVVLADIPDPHGQPCDHPHTCMVLRSSDCDPNIYLVAISTKFTDPLPSDWLPMLHAPGGHPITGLKYPCVLKCNWIVKFLATAVKRRIGAVPPPVLDEAIDVIEKAIRRKKRN